MRRRKRFLVQRTLYKLKNCSDAGYWKDSAERLKLEKFSFDDASRRGFTCNLVMTQKRAAE